MRVALCYSFRKFLSLINISFNFGCINKLTKLAYLLRKKAKLRFLASNSKPISCEWRVCLGSYTIFGGHN